MLDVDHWPACSDAVLLYSFRGWVDAGIAGAGAIDAVIQQMSGAERFGTIDLTDLLDLQQVRPTVQLIDGGLRQIEWPMVELWSGTLGRDVIAIRGPEPSIRWPTFAASIVDSANRLRVSDAVALGGMPALTTHRRPVPVLATAATRSLAQEIGALRDDYVGPTGLNTVVQHALGVAGIRSAALWAQVPQYVSGSPSPPAVRSLLARLEATFRIHPELAALDRRAAAYRDRVEEGLVERPDVRSIVDQLDHQLDHPGESVDTLPDDLPSGDELADEIERFLRTRDDD
jgi:hypothetical protein